MLMFQMQHIVFGTKFNHLILECRNAFFPPRYFEIASIDEYLVCEKFRSILPNGLNLMGIVVGGHFWPVHFFLTKRLFYSGIRHFFSRLVLLLVYALLLLPKCYSISVFMNVIVTRAALHLTRRHVYDTRNTEERNKC